MCKATRKMLTNKKYSSRNVYVFHETEKRKDYAIFKSKKVKFFFRRISENHVGAVRSYFRTNESEST